MLERAAWFLLSLSLFACGSDSGGDGGSGGSATGGSPGGGAGGTAAGGSGGNLGGTAGSGGSGGSAASAGDAGADASLAPLLVGKWEQPAPYIAVLRFDANGTVTVASFEAELDTKPMASGTWALAGSQLTFVNTSGVCSTPVSNQTGVYDIVVTATTLSFSMQNDPCPQRNVIDGETWKKLP